MEAIAAAASIAGIITLAAQAIDGLQKLHSFFADISTASKTVSRLLADINSLIAVLQNIDNILYQVESQRKDQNFASLDIKLEDCTKDVKSWLVLARELRPGGEKGGRAWVRRARLVAKGDVVGRIREEIGRHRQALCLSLAVFGRTIDLHTSEQIYQMRGRFDDALTNSLSNHGAHEEALRRIEHYSITSMRSSAHSIKSMDSIRTELSRLEAMITSSQTESTSRIEEPEADPLVGSSGNQDRPMVSKVIEQTFTPDALTDPMPANLLGPSGSHDSRRGSSSPSNYSSNASSVIHAGARMRFNARTRPAELHDLVKEQEDISKRFSEISNGHESALLYAEFSRIDSPATKKHKDDTKQKHKIEPVLGNSERFLPETPPKRTLGSLGRSTQLSGSFRDSSVANESQPSRSERTSISHRVDGKPHDSHDSFPGTKEKSYHFDPASTYKLLQQSLAELYSPTVAEFVSLRNLASLCETHLKLLEQSPEITSDLAKNKGSSHSAVVEAHIRKLKDQLEALQDATDISIKNCIEAGYSMSELDKIFSSNLEDSSRRKITQASAGINEDTTSYEVQGSTAGGHISDDSDAYYSTAE